MSKKLGFAAMGKPTLISIHALLAESDALIIQSRLRSWISIHALLAESDILPLFGTSYSKKFLSTLSLRRATWGPRWIECRHPRFLSTLSLRRATGQVSGSVHRTMISIHALLAESDALRSPRIALMVGFLSTLSLRRATSSRFLLFGTHPISIHALLAESDAVYLFPICRRPYNFYPRSPCGERLILLLLCNAKPDFYPRSPCGERLSAELRMF